MKGKGKRHWPKAKKRPLTSFQRRAICRTSGAAGSVVGGDKRPAPVVVVTTPNTLSVVEEPDLAARFLSAIRDRRHQGKPLRIRSANVTRVTPDGLLALLANIQDCQCLVSGDLPNNASAMADFKASGIFDHMPHAWTDVPTRGTVFTREAGTKVIGEFARQWIKFAVAKLGKPGGRLLGVYRALLECMANTDDHAAGVIKSSEPTSWYVHTGHDVARGVVSFTFLDYGIGIVESLALRGFDVLRRHLKNDGVILLRAFDGEFSSRTGKKNRGLGLRGIRDEARKGQLSRLVAVANHGYVDVLAGRTRRLRANFPGTLIYWEVQAHNVLV